MKTSHYLKIFSGILLVLSALTQGAWAQDTMKVCTYPDPLSTAVSFDLLCPRGYEDNDARAFYNGQVYYPGEHIVSLGASGLVDVYCDDGNPFTIDSTIDTTIFVQSIGIPSICIISSDSNNHPVIYVDSASLFGIDTIQVLRQLTTSSWQTVASFTPNDPLVITDTTANTASQSYTYSIQSRYCLINFSHTTIHLQSNGNNLSWNPYAYATYWLPWDTNAPPPLQGYYIYKRNGTGNFILIDSTIGSTYTDLNFQNGAEYFVEAIKIDGCSSNAWQKTGSPLGVRSNRLQVGTIGIGQPEQPWVNYFVDGSALFVELKKPNDVWIHDLLGRVLVHQYTDRLSIPLKSGIYILHAGTKGYKVLVN